MKVHTAWQTHLVDSWWSCINIYTPYWLRVGFSENKWDLSALKNFWHSKFLKLQPGSMDIEQGQTREVHHSFRNAPKNVTPIWFDTWNFVFSGPGINSMVSRLCLCQIGQYKFTDVSLPYKLKYSSRKRNAGTHEGSKQICVPPLLSQLSCLK